MTFSRHPDYDELLRLWPAVQSYQELAAKHGISDIFQDNGGKLLQVLLLLGLESLPGRLGNDARDKTGREYELKSANVELAPGFSTHHHLNETILAKYRQVPWVFASYRNITLLEVHTMEPEQLSALFDRWEAQLAEMKRVNVEGREISLNNRKIPVKFVREHGRLVYAAPPEFAERAEASPIPTPDDTEGGFEPG